MVQVSRHEGGMLEWFTALSLRSRIKWLLTGLLGLTLVPIIQGFFSAMAEEAGWYKKPIERAEAVTTWFHAILADRAFQWFVIGLAGFVAGLWVDAFLAKREKSSIAVEQAPAEAPPAATPVIDRVLPDITMVDAIKEAIKRAKTVITNKEEFYKGLSLALADTIQLEGMSVWGRRGSRPIEKIPSFVWAESSLVVEEETCSLASPNMDGTTIMWWTSLMINSLEMEKTLLLDWPKDEGH